MTSSEQAPGSTPSASTEEPKSSPEQETQQQAAAPEPAPIASWDDLGLAPEVLESVKSAGFKTPTPIQVQAIPIALKHIDIIASSQTGTGKTAAFGLPMINHLRGRQGTFGLVLAPTREIALQIHNNLTLLGAPLGVRSICLIGGVGFEHDAAGIGSYPHIIVATPGRLCDHLDRGNVWLNYIEVVVLDEADRMLDMGFTTQLDRIMDEVPQQRQTLLFSATIPRQVKQLADRILFEPESLSVNPPRSTAETVEQSLIRVPEEAKTRELIRWHKREPGSMIVFTRSKDGATRLWRSMHSAGIYDATYLHSDRPQADREKALEDFKKGIYKTLIATDVAARGLHIEGVSLVINFDLPLEADSYVHRIGRTGRAGASGRAVTFVTQKDRKLLDEIERYIGKPIPVLDEGQGAAKESRGASAKARPAGSEPLAGPGPRPKIESRTGTESAPRPPSGRAPRENSKPQKNANGQRGPKAAAAPAKKLLDPKSGAYQPISALDFLKFLPPPESGAKAAPGPSGRPPQSGRPPKKR
jgi:ATP-dependent RNA helicase RhlE